MAFTKPGELFPKNEQERLSKRVQAVLNKGAHTKY